LVPGRIACARKRARWARTFWRELIGFAGRLFVLCDVGLDDTAAIF